MKAGKIGAQCGHATLMTLEKADKHMPELSQSWRTKNQPIQVYHAKSEQDLDSLYESARENSLVSSIVYDAGRTQIPEGSCLLFSSV